MARAIFLTGFPGFIAGHLVRRMLAEEGTTIRFLVIPPMEEKARAAREALGPEAAARTAIILGDITRPGLGLADADFARLRAEVDTVYHLAAIYDLATPEEVARLVNVTGTENVLAFASALPKLRRVIYFSTAYVSGTRRGTVKEDELEEAAGWKNFYEQTKWEAEVAVRRRMPRLPVVIIRPGVVVGDSKSGEIPKYDGPYFAIRAMCALERKGRIRRARAFAVGGKDVNFYLVPVDFVCDAVEHLAKAEGAPGRAYHVLPGKPITMQGMMKRLFEVFGVQPPRFRPPPWIGRVFLTLFPGLARRFQFPRELLDYMRHEVHYDTANLDAALAGSGIVCPRAEDYLPVLVDWVRAHPEIKPNFGEHASSRRELVTTDGAAAGANGAAPAPETQAEKGTGPEPPPAPDAPDAPAPPAATEAPPAPPPA
ncbi:MAG: SDR family oxidoreductase [Planctomycetes bacterium]|nr:SDR family oxidoreductase [Planctomycetota bacterium]